MTARACDAAHEAGREGSLPASPLLMLVTAPSERLSEIVLAAVAGGVNMVQLRDKTATARSVYASALALRKVIGGRAAFVVNGPGWDLTVGGADIAGAHLPEFADCGTLLPRSSKDDGPVRPLVGRSVHGVARAIEARDEGAEYLVAGAVFATASHPGEPGQALDFLREVCAAVAPLPVIAIGGITPERVGECVGAGASGVAVLSAIMKASDPEAAASRYREELDKAWNLRSTAKR